MGNLILARKAGRIIAISVLVTVVAAAFFTVISPLRMLAKTNWTISHGFGLME
jgi:hypothetical protein